MQWLLEADRGLWLLGGLLLFLVGFGMGRVSGKTLERRNASLAQERDHAFFKGFQYILSNEHDQAIEEFTKSVQVNSDTVETYVALGNLYRSKGDIDRAIRIRQSIILRPNLEKSIRLNALYELGMDYRKGGLINRALQTFLKVVQEDPGQIKAQEEMERIYEDLKDWDNAILVRQRLSRLLPGEHRHILAHQMVEAGKVCQENGDPAKAQGLYNKAVSTHKGCIDAYLHLGDLYFEKQDFKKAIATWKKVAEVSPGYTFLAYRRLEGAYREMKNLKPVEEFLRECVQARPDAFTHLALARFLYNERDTEGALAELDRALNLGPSLWEAWRFQGEILLASDRRQESVSAYARLLTHLDLSSLRFQCSQCGYRPNDLQWRCPQCRNWDTIGPIPSETVPQAAPVQELSLQTSVRVPS